MKKEWYVIYSKPRWEKKVAQLLTEQEIENYCPLNIVRKKWSDRIKKVEVPLFTSYVFVRISEGEKTAVRETLGVINFVYSENKPAVVKDKEIERIQRFLSEFENVEVVAGLLQKDQRIVVNSGLFIEKEGRVVDVQNNKVIVEIDSLGYSLTAAFNRSEISTNHKI